MSVSYYLIIFIGLNSDNKAKIINLMLEVATWRPKGAPHWPRVTQPGPSRTAANSLDANTASVHDLGHRASQVQGRGDQFVSSDHGRKSPGCRLCSLFLFSFLPGKQFNGFSSHWAWRTLASSQSVPLLPLFKDHG